MRTAIRLFRLQVVDEDNRLVLTMNGAGPIERHLIFEAVRAVDARLGWWRSRTAVKAAVAEALMAVVDGVKADVERGAVRD